MPLSANFVNVAFKFEEQPSDGFTMGERVGVVVGVINTHATKEINVTSAMGSMNYPQDFSAYVANFSQQMFTANNIPVTIPPGQECSFTYNFYTPSALQVDYPYQMALSLFYEDDVRSLVVGVVGSLWCVLFFVGGSHGWKPDTFRGDGWKVVGF